MAKAPNFSGASAVCGLGVSAGSDTMKLQYLRRLKGISAPKSLALRPKHGRSKSMVDHSKSGNKSKTFASDEILFPLPTLVWVRICKAGKKSRFFEAVSLGRSIAFFDVEGFCESEGIQLSKAERRLWVSLLQGSKKYVLPKVSK